MSTPSNFNGDSRAIMQACFDITIKKLQEFSSAIVDSTIDHLFKAAEHAKNNKEQNIYFDAINSFKRQPNHLASTYIKAFQGSVNNFWQVAAKFNHSNNNSQYDIESELSLVDDTILEESLAVSAMVSKAEIQQVGALYALNCRLSVVISSTIDNKNNPCAPYNLGNCLKKASSSIDAHVIAKLELFKQFENNVINNLGALYQALNDMLIKQGVLPNLKYKATKTANTAVASQNTELPSDKETNTVTDNANLNQAAATSQQSTQHHATINTLNEILDLFSEKRGVQSQLVSPGLTSGDQVAPQAVIQEALSELQTNIFGRSDNSSPGLISVPNLKNNLLNVIRETDPGGNHTTLSHETSDMIDLMGMMMEYVHKLKIIQGPIQKLVEAIQVPLLEQAIKNKRLFEDKEHPARQLLNVLVSNAHFWSDDGSNKDNEGQKKLNESIDKIRTSKDNEQLFTQLLGEISEYIDDQKRKVETIEKRHVAASLGKEKLQLAKLRALNEIRNRIETHRPPRLIRTFLEKAWRDVLSITLLRNGEDSDAWQEALTIADDLIQSTKANLDDIARKRLLDREESFNNAIQHGLNMIGFYEQEINEILVKLKEVRNWALVNQEPENKPGFVDQQVFSKRKFSAQSEVSDEKEEKIEVLKQENDEKEEKKSLDEKEITLLNQVKKLPFGIWFEFVEKESKKTTRRKLAWYSIVTEKCLFVNHKGQKDKEISMVTLVKGIGDKTITMIKQEKKPVFDRAMDMIKKQLKKVNFGREK